MRKLLDCQLYMRYKGFDTKWEMGSATFLAVLRTQK